ncbi:hypothetical protein [Stenotrophomonas indicatrix]|uniref:hypothetical protein n=1 Tax=Stenotrophomonas indicatrix TaxID=2045451 RepID=UPI001F0BCF63|nr:hypothetical protein [Stenotrophomonas indicatrix]
MQAPQDAKVGMGKGMDTKFLVETPIASQLHVETLTFHGLYTRVQGLIDRSIYPKPSGIECWSMRIAVIAAIVGIVSGLWLVHWVPVSTLLPITVTCLLVEIGGFAVNGALSVLRQYQQYLQPRLSHAKEMDSEFAQWRALVGELQRFPKIEREQRLRFATALRAGMVDRMGLLYGGLQRLGPFPLIVALFVQYQAWKSAVSGLEEGRLGRCVRRRIGGRHPYLFHCATLRRRLAPDRSAHSTGCLHKPA